MVKPTKKTEIFLIIIIFLHEHWFNLSLFYVVLFHLKQKFQGLLSSPSVYKKNCSIHSIGVLEIAASATSKQSKLKLQNTCANTSEVWKQNKTTSYQYTGICSLSWLPTSINKSNRSSNCACTCFVRVSVCAVCACRYVRVKFTRNTNRFSIDVHVLYQWQIWIFNNRLEV